MVGLLGNMTLSPRSRSKVKGQIRYFLVNAPSPKLLDVATSNSAGA